MQIKRTLTFFEEVRARGRAADRSAAAQGRAAAVIDNPFAGRFERDLSPLTNESAAIGQHICQIAVALLCPHKAESYGKAALIGMNGEQEHGVAMLTTVFGNVMREAAGGGKAWISSLTKRAAPGATIDIPLAHKDALYVRSHYDGITVMLPDAPLPDETGDHLRLRQPRPAEPPGRRAGGRRNQGPRRADLRRRREHATIDGADHDDLQDRRGAHQVAEGRPHGLHRRQAGGRRHRASGVPQLGEVRGLALRFPGAARRTSS